ncbi:hypothetical protein [Planktothrix pseudagardhii]|uniref:Uncharacterized protein n=1 Tax=Planktothrix pseudagardhii TaxID=132604 RepID=A0A9W4CSP2_9CYAN|nr:hypothetical protein [Planktothrix pseudagardhii]CAD5982755.1 hypothetical protein NO713_05060 [Planktothrix pseudagardhii]
MSILKSHYEALLAEYSNSEAAITLLKQHRPYFEMVPSIRRSDDSVITIPLPIVRLRHGVSYSGQQGISIKPGDAVGLPCDIGLLMCDPEWKVKIGAEIFIFIHRPQEELSDLLARWRLTQVLLDQDYEWIMPHHYKHIDSQEADDIYPLFVLFPETSERIKRGLIGANLPFVIHSVEEMADNYEYPDLDQIESEEYQEFGGEWG